MKICLFLPIVIWFVAYWQTWIWCNICALYRLLKGFINGSRHILMMYGHWMETECYCTMSGLSILINEEDKCLIYFPYSTILDLQVFNACFLLHEVECINSYMLKPSDLFIVIIIFGRPDFSKIDWTWLSSRAMVDRLLGMLYKNHDCCARTHFKQFGSVSIILRIIFCFSRLFLLQELLTWNDKTLFAASLPAIFEVVLCWNCFFNIDVFL